MINGVSETAKNIKNVLITTTTAAAKIITDSLKNIRVEDLTKIFIQDPRTLCNLRHQTQIINIQYNSTLSMNDIDVILPEMININAISFTDLDNYYINDDLVLTQSEIERNEEYLLSIHSTKIRSNGRDHNHEIDTTDVVNLDCKIIDMVESKLCHNERAIKVLNDIANKDKIEINSISFSGGGYNCMYHIGVARYIFENPELFKDTKYLGASGGAGIVALLLCFENDPDRFKILQEILDFVIGLHDKHLKLRKQVNEYSKLLFQYMSEERFNECILNSDRCHISVTNITYIIPYNEIKTKFTSYSQFMDTLRASACIPFLLDNKIRTVDDKKYLDGGLSNNLPIIDKNTLKISCLNYPFLDADLYPKYICHIMYSFTPPDKNYIMNMHDQGYNDIEQYMKDKYHKLQEKKQDHVLNECITKLIDDPDFCI